MKRKITNYILPILAFALSANQLIFNTSPDHFLTITVAISGMMAGIVYFVKPQYFFKIIHFWIIAQIPSIVKILISDETGEAAEQVKPIVEASQSFNVSFGLTYPKDYGTLQVYLNVMPILYYALLYQMHKSFAATRKLVVKSFRAGNIFDYQLPIHGQVVGSHKANDDLWFSIKLEKSLHHEEQEYPAILARPKGSKRFKINTEYVAHLRLVKDIDSLGDEIENIDDYEFVDWFIIG